MDIGLGGISADDFTILMAIRLKWPKDVSSTKVIAKLFHAILKAESRARIPSQMQYTEEMETLAQPNDTPDCSKLRYYFSKTQKSQQDRGGAFTLNLVGTI